MDKMKIRTEFPRAIREVTDLWVPMPDGGRLSARMWLPVDAAVALDARGTGESDGLIEDEYADRELDDGVAAIAWLAAQPWCTGAVGIWGLSWSGQNALQIAARRPPQLRAVISLGAADDLYSDDAEYMGGCLLVSQFNWTTTVHALMAQPPHPSIVGARWREQWIERIEQMAPFLEYRLRHQRRDAYWKRGSVCEDYGAITCPVYMIGGWFDGYVNAVLSFLANSPGPRKGLIGPWAHGLPHVGGPEPTIGFLQECLRWWDQWLKGIDTGILGEPMLRTWLQESVEPRVHYDARPGSWVAEPTWPSPKTEPYVLALNAGSLDDHAGPETPLVHQSPLHLGQRAGPWLIGARSPDFPPDQREDDALALTFDSAPLEAPLVLLGQPVVTLELSVDRPLAMVAVRLCDVRPDRSSLLITRGLLNLTHRQSHEYPTPLEPGRRYSVTIPLKAIGQIMPVGHRIRVAISTSYWPFAWPSPEPVTLTVFAGLACQLVLALRPPRPDDGALPAFSEPETAPSPELQNLRTFKHTWTTEHDLVAGRHVTAFRTDGGLDRLVASGIEYGFAAANIYTIVADDPLSAQARFERTIEIAHGNWQTRVELTGLVTADATTFRATLDLHAYEGNTRVATKSWNLAIPRDLV
jgi:uncharacterized protein